MTLISFLLLLLIAAVAGLVGQAIAGYSLGGCIVSIVLGFVGAFIGLWIARAAGLPTFFTIDIGGEAFPVVWAIIGSALLSLTIGLIRRRGLI